MSKPVHQHFIPRSYLNKFGEETDGKHFIGALKKGSDTVIRLSTKDVCVDKNLYTLPDPTGQNKFAVEHFYADNIDNKFSEIHELLTNPDIKEINIETKIIVISTALSLYFRTPKFLNQENGILTDLIRKQKENADTENFEVHYADQTITVKKEEAEQVIKDYKERNRIRFLSEHLISFEKFVRAKANDIIYVYRIIDGTEFVASDNPVIIRPYIDLNDRKAVEEYSNKDINPFDPLNTIHLPLDRKHILTLLPNPDNDLSLTIRRLDKKKIDTILYNSEQDKLAELWILGGTAGLKAHIADQQEFKTETPQAVKQMEEYKEMALALKDLVLLMEKEGVGHDKVLLYANEMAKLEGIKRDPNFKRIFREIMMANMLERFAKAKDA